MATIDTIIEVLDNKILSSTPTNLNNSVGLITRFTIDSYKDQLWNIFIPDLVAYDNVVAYELKDVDLSGSSAVYNINLIFSTRRVLSDTSIFDIPDITDYLLGIFISDPNIELRGLKTDVDSVINNYFPSSRSSYLEDIFSVLEIQYRSVIQNTVCNTCRYIIIPSM